MLTIYTVPCGILRANSYIVTCDGERAVLIDCGGAEPLAFAKKKGLTIEAVLLTHGHFDHIMGCAALQASGAKIGCSSAERSLIFSGDNLAEEMGLTVNDLTFDDESTGPNEDLVAEVNGFTEEGESTDPIESDIGIYVGQLTSLLDRDATDQEKNNIVEERRQEQYDSLLEEWRDAAAIEVDEKVWEKVDFNDVGVTIITPEEETEGSERRRF